MKFPKNGEELLLVADGGEFGLLVPCPECDGAGKLPVHSSWVKMGYAQPICRRCSGDGELHQQWHAVGQACYQHCNPPQPDESPDDSSRAGSNDRSEGAEGPTLPERVDAWQLAAENRRKFEADPDADYSYAPSVVKETAEYRAGIPIPEECLSGRCLSQRLGKRHEQYPEAGEPSPIPDYTNPAPLTDGGFLREGRQLLDLVDGSHRDLVEAIVREIARRLIDNGR